jgi:hypothetical protein
VGFCKYGVAAIRRAHEHVALRLLKSNSSLVARAATVRAQITYALEVALEWIALVLTVLIAVGAMLVATVLYSIIWFVQRLLEGP